jgi:hypothetical protein
MNGADHCLVSRAAPTAGPMPHRRSDQPCPSARRHRHRPVAFRHLRSVMATVPLLFLWPPPLSLPPRHLSPFSCVGRRSPPPPQPRAHRCRTPLFRRACTPVRLPIVRRMLLPSTRAAVAGAVWPCRASACAVGCTHAAQAGAKLGQAVGHAHAAQAGAKLGQAVGRALLGSWATADSALWHSIIIFLFSEHIQILVNSKICVGLI